MKNNSEILSYMLCGLYPLIILFGLYIIINGHNSPGGGFQGGAVLSSAFITRYLVYAELDFTVRPFQAIEKIFFLCIVMFPILYLFMEFIPRTSLMNQAYLMLMNFLIGVKVCCGLTLIFFRFVFYEGRL